MTDLSTVSPLALLPDGANVLLTAPSPTDASKRIAALLPVGALARAMAPMVLANAQLPGTPSAQTPDPTDRSTLLATTAFVGVALDPIRTALGGKLDATAAAQLYAPVAGGGAGYATPSNVAAAVQQAVAGLGMAGRSNMYSDLAGRPQLGTAAPLNVGVAAGTVAAGDDARIVGALSTTLAAATYATPAQVSATVQALVGAAPDALDTLGKIAAELQGDETTIGGVIAAVATKLDAATAAGLYLRQADAAATYATPTQVNATVQTVAGTAVSAAINALPTVAHSGIYGDLTGKPALGTAAPLNVGQVAGTVAAGDDARITGALSAATAATTYATPAAVAAAVGAGVAALPAAARSGTYTDLTDKPALGTAAPLNVGQVAGTVAAGDDARITGALSAATAAVTYATSTAVTNAVTATVSAAVGALPPVAHSGAYGDLTGKPALGTAAPLNVGQVAGTVAAGDDARITGALAATAAAATYTTPAAVTATVGAAVSAAVAGLSQAARSGAYADLTGKPALGAAALLNVGQVAGTVAAGDDARITGALAASTASATYTTPAQVNATVQAVVGAAPVALNTLAKIASELQGDETTIGGLVSAVAGKLDTAMAASTYLRQIDAAATYTTSAQVGTAAQAIATAAVNGALSALPAVAHSGSYADLSNKPALGTAAALNVGQAAGTVAAGDDARLIGALQAASLAAATILVPGSVVARSLVARAGDTVWLQDYGTIDPTGVADSTAAFQAAVATGRHVRVPDGLFKIRQMLTLAAGQGLICTDRGTATLSIGPDFAPSASSVIAGPAMGAGPILRNIGFSFAQPSTLTSRAAFQTLTQANGSGAVGIKYPPAIDFTGLPRFILDNIRISGAWDGIKATGNCGGAWMRQIEVGALNIGLQMDGAQDFVHIDGYHFWCFGLQTGTTFTGVFLDGQTIAMKLGEVDGLNASDVNTYGGRIVITANAANGPPLTFTGLNLDDFGSLEVAGGSVGVANLYSTSESNDTTPRILVAGGVVAISTVYLWGNPTAPLATVTGGSCLIDGGHIIQNTVLQPAITQSGGTLILRDLHMMPGNGHNYPYVQQTAGVIDIQGCKWNTAGNAALSIAADNAANVVTNNDTGGAAITLPTGALTGVYGPNFPLPHGNFAVTDYAGNSVFFRIAGGGQLQLLSSAYSAVLFGLTQAGDLYTPSSLSTSTYNVQTAGVTRYQLSGGDVLGMNAYTAGGAFAGVVLSINNATQTVTFNQSPVLPTAPAQASDGRAASTLYVDRAVAAGGGGGSAAPASSTTSGTIQLDQSLAAWATRPREPHPDINGIVTVNALRAAGAIGDGTSHTVDATLGPRISGYSGMTGAQKLAALQALPLIIAPQIQSLTDEMDLVAFWAVKTSVMAAGGGLIDAGYGTFMCNRKLPQIPAAYDENGVRQATWSLRGDGSPHCVFKCMFDVATYDTDFFIEVANRANADGSNYEGHITGVMFTGPAASFTRGSRVCHIRGMGWGARRKLTDVAFHGFDRGLCIQGDQTKFESLRISNCTFGVTWDLANGTLYGDFLFDRALISNCMVACVSASSNSEIPKVVWDKCIFATSPICFAKEVVSSGMNNPVLCFENHFVSPQFENPGYSAFGEIDSVTLRPNPNAASYNAVGWSCVQMTRAQFGPWNTSCSFPGINPSAMLGEFQNALGQNDIEISNEPSLTPGSNGLLNIVNFDQFYSGNKTIIRADLDQVFNTLSSVTNTSGYARGTFLGAAAQGGTLNHLVLIGPAYSGKFFYDANGSNPPKGTIVSLLDSRGNYKLPLGTAADANVAGVGCIRYNRLDGGSPQPQHFVVLRGTFSAIAGTVTWTGNALVRTAASPAPFAVASGAGDTTSTVFGLTDGTPYTDTSYSGGKAIGIRYIERFNWIDS